MNRTTDDQRFQDRLAVFKRSGTCIGESVADRVRMGRYTKDHRELSCSRSSDGMTSESFKLGSKQIGTRTEDMAAIGVGF